MKPLRHRELLLSLKYATIEACFSVPMLNLTTVNMPFAIGFAVQALGFKSAAIGLMAATPHLCNFLQPPITWFLQKFFSLYQIMIMGFVLNALPWAFIFTLPYLGYNSVVVFGLIVLVSTIANAVCAVAWSASVSQVVPLNIRGKYFGQRNMIFGFWTLVVILAAGQLVDHFDNSLEIFSWIFAIAALMRLIGLFFLTRMKFPQPVMERSKETVPMRRYFSVLKDLNYVVLLLFIGSFGFFLNLGAPFYNVYVLRELHLTMGDLTILTTLSSAGGLLSLRTWGALTDRFGNKPVLITCALLWSITGIAAWFFAAPGRHEHLFLTYFLVGYMTAGFQLCQFNLMIKLVPTETKAHYISVFFAVTSLLTAFGPIVGGKILAWLPLEMGTFLGGHLQKFHIVFVGSLILCLCSVNILQMLREPAERPWRELVGVMRGMREFNPLIGLSTLTSYVFTPRAITRLARESVRTLRRQTKDVSDVGEELMESSLRAVTRPFKDRDKEE